MKRVFVTGGTGLLGANLIELLLEQNLQVVALVRDESRYVGMRGKNLKIIEGGLFDDITHHLSDVDFVIHIAALTAHNLLSYAEYHKINDDATLHLYSCASQAHVKRFLFVSSANTMGFGDANNPGTELSLPRFPFNRSFYAQSKKSAEEHLLSQERETEVCIVNPTFMLGAYDSKPSSGQIITRIIGKRIIFFPPGGKNFIHVKDVSEGILRVLEKGKRGERYLLANLNLSYLEFYQQVLKTIEQDSIFVKVPCWLLHSVGMLGNVLRWLGVAVNFSSINVRMLCINNYFSNGKSVDELSMEYRDIKIAIEDAVRWWESSNSKQQ